VPPSGQAAAQAGASAAHADSVVLGVVVDGVLVVEEVDGVVVVLVVLVALALELLVLELLEIVGPVVDDGDGTLLLVDDDVVDEVDGDAELVLVVEDVVVTAPVPSGAQSSCTALGRTVRVPN